MWCIDKNYTLLHFNKTFQNDVASNHKILVYRGINIISLIDSEEEKKDYEYWKNIYDDIFKTGITKTIFHDTETQFIKIVLNPIFEHKTNDVKYLVGIIEDVTSNKKIENDLKEKNKSLEQFAYITAHDLKTPLRSLSGLVNTLLKYIDTFDNKEQVKITKIVDMIKENSIKMSEIIDATLSYSRASKELVKVKYSIRESLLIAISNLNYMVNNPNVIINNLINGLFIEADQGQINQLFQNLISNAIKFNDKEKKIITIGYLPNDEGFYVEDNGCGIDEKYIPKLFKMFQRLNVEKEGTGIGLAIVKKVIENHNWSIKVESQLNVGTIFKIIFNKNV